MPPHVSVNLLKPWGGDHNGPFPDAIKVEGAENSAYVWSYNSETGTVEFSLKDPFAGAASSENVTIIVDGKSYIVQVGSTAGETMDQITNWALVDEGIAYADRAWGGLVDGHYKGEHIETPTGYENTELHLQMYDRSLGVECQHVVHPPNSFDAGGFLPRALWGR